MSEKRVLTKQEGIQMPFLLVGKTSSWVRLEGRFWSHQDPDKM